MLIGYPYLTVPTATKGLNKATPQGISHAVNQLVDIGILQKLEGKYRHEYRAPEVMQILTRESTRGIH